MVLGKTEYSNAVNARYTFQLLMSFCSELTIRMCKEHYSLVWYIILHCLCFIVQVGYDAGDQFSFHWWDHVFNKTVKSIVVQENDVRK